MYINMCSLYMFPDDVQKTPQNIKHPPNQNNNSNKKTYKEVPYLES